MNVDNQKISVDDEIDLKELAFSLWHGRKLIMICMAAAICLSSAYLWVAERKYSVTYIFQPATSDEGGPSFGGLGGLASLAGVSLPKAESSDFQTFQMLLQSEETAAELMKKRDLVRRVFASEWNEETQKFIAPERSLMGAVTGTLKFALTGESRPDYVPPNAARLAEYLKEAFSKSEDRETGFLRLATETAKPDLIIDLMTAATATTDKIIRDRFVVQGLETLEFYQSKIVSARSREHREALAQLIVQEEQKLMLATVGGHFVAKPLTSPSVSLRPTSPKASLVLALALVLGTFIGAALVLIKKALQNE